MRRERRRRRRPPRVSCRAARLSSSLVSFAPSPPSCRWAPARASRRSSAAGAGAAMTWARTRRDARLSRWRPTSRRVCIGYPPARRVRGARPCPPTPPPPDTPASRSPARGSAPRAPCARHARVQRQIRHASPRGCDRDATVRTSLDRAQSTEQIPSRVQLSLRGRVQPRELARIRAPRREVQRQRREIRGFDLRRIIRPQRGVRHLGPHPVARPGRDATRSSPTLIRPVRAKLKRRPIASSLHEGEPRRAAKARVHHHAHARDGQRALRDGRADDDASRARRRGGERGGRGPRATTRREAGARRTPTVAAQRRDHR